MKKICLVLSFFIVTIAQVCIAQGSFKGIMSNHFQRANAKQVKASDPSEKIVVYSSNPFFSIILKGVFLSTRLQCLFLWAPFREKIRRQAEKC